MQRGIDRDRRAGVNHGYSGYENFFPLLGVEPAIGRSFMREECLGEYSAPPAMVLSYSSWRSGLGPDPRFCSSILYAHFRLRTLTVEDLDVGLGLSGNVRGNERVGLFSAIHRAGQDNSPMDIAKEQWYLCDVQRKGYGF